MPTFTIETPGGKRLTIEAGDEATAMAGAQEWHATQTQPALSNAAPPQPEPEGAPVTGLGLAKQYGVGAGKAAIGFAGSAGDLPGQAASTVEGLTGSPLAGKIAKAAVYTSPFGMLAATGPRSSTIQRGVESVTGEFRKPQNTAEELAQTGGEFSLGAMLPGGIGQRLARAILPAATSETAGRVTREVAPEYEPVARALTTIATPTGGRRGGPGPAPTRDALRAESDAQYKTVRDSPVEFTPQLAGTLADRVEAALAKEGFREKNAPMTFDGIRDLRANGTTFATIDDARKIMNAAGKNVTTPDAKASGIATRALDDATANIPASYVVRGHAELPGTLQTQLDARGNYGASARAKTVEKADARGDLNANVAGSGGNVDNAKRQAFASILRNENKLRGMSPEEVAQINRVAEGTRTGNLARHVGKLAPTGVVSGAMSSGAGFLTGGPMGAVAFPAVGQVAKMIGDRSTRANINELSEAVRRRSPLGRFVPDRPDTRNRERIIRALLASEHGS